MAGRMFPLMCLVQGLAVAGHIVRRAVQPALVAVDTSVDEYASQSEDLAETSYAGAHLKVPGDVHYFQVPKTGSTNYYSRLQVCARQAGLKYHSHGDAACATGLLNNAAYDDMYDPSDNETRNCNASYARTRWPNAKFVAVIREPCERFMSVFWHLKRILEADPRSGSFKLKQLTTRSGSFKLKSMTSELDLLDWINETMQGCPQSGDDVKETRCMVEAISNNFKVAHRVVLWPQAMFFESQTTPVCYDANPHVFDARMKEAFAGSCDVSSWHTSRLLNRHPHPTQIDAVTCKRVKDLYTADARWWSKSCT